MAYTYDDFTKAAQSAGMLERFSQTDLDTAKTKPEYGLSMLKLYQDEAGANTAEQRLLAQEAMNQLRKSYGTIPSQPDSQGGFQFQKETEYQKLLDSVVNRPEFDYQASQDPQYQAYRKGYLREADRAREDTLAQVSANSGGTPSSFAVTAAQQAGDYYVGQLNDKVPTLQQNAYQRYLNNFQGDLTALEALGAERDFDYSIYLQNLQKQMEAAQLMASLGDYTRLAQMYGLTPEELALLMQPSGGNIIVNSDGGQKPGLKPSFQPVYYQGDALPVTGPTTITPTGDQPMTQHAGVVGNGAIRGLSGMSDEDLRALLILLQNKSSGKPKADGITGKNDRVVLPTIMGN